MSSTITFEEYEMLYSTFSCFFTTADTTGQPASKPISNNKEELIRLNNRLDQFMKKVLDLEERKANLEKEVLELKNRRFQGNNICEDERKKLQNELNEEKIKCVKQQIKNAVLQLRYNKECSGRAQTEGRIEKYKKNQEDAMTRKKNLNTNIQCWKNHLQKSQDFINTLSKEQQLPPEKVKQFEQQVQASKNEADELKRQLEFKITELKSVQETKENLEKENEKIELDHKTQIEDYKQEMSTLSKELNKALSDKSDLHLEYLIVVHDKSKLEKEIEKYRNLLEKGEGHIKPPQENKPPTKK